MREGCPHRFSGTTLATWWVAPHRHPMRNTRFFTNWPRVLLLCRPASGNMAGVIGVCGERLVWVAFTHEHFKGGFQMSRLCSFLVAGLAVAAFAAVANAQINPIGPFTGDAQEKFDCRVVFKPCMAPDCPTMFGSNTNTLCTPGKAGTHTTGSWGFRCTIRARSAPMFFGSAQGWVRYTFDPPVGRFGGYFGSNAPNRGENNDAEVRFRDEDGNSLGTGVAKVGDGDCLWHWNGWESTGKLIAEIDVEGKLFGGAFIDMDDMEIAAGPEIDCDAITRFKAKCRRNKLKGMIKRSSLPEGTQLTLLNNGGDAKVVNINRRGKGKAKWTRQSGKHEVTIQECPNIPGKEADCGE